MNEKEEGLNAERDLGITDLCYALLAADKQIN